MNEFNKFSLHETVIDKTKQRKSILQALLNKGPKYSSHWRPLIIYCQEISRVVVWLDAMTMEIIFRAVVPSEVLGRFVKSVGYENFEIESEMGRVTNSDCIYAVSCTDNKIYFYK